MVVHVCHRTIDLNALKTSLGDARGSASCVAVSLKGLL